MLSAIEISRTTKLKNISEVAGELGINSDDIIQHGKYIATILQSPDKYPEVIQALELISSMVNRGAYKTSLLAA